MEKKSSISHPLFIYDLPKHLSIEFMQTELAKIIKEKANYDIDVIPKIKSKPLETL